ncbi:hypothetical protein HDU91_000144 [Kappamyces sp. JEL0680]|nr:hypothetical protein HDU91_000144 [Kappamyces sp. JEL0680]
MTCSKDQHILSLNLNDQALNGAIPASLASLSSLQVLALAGNKLGGTIPESLSGLSQLTFLDISQNQLTGTVPSQLSQLSNLSTLILSGNRLSGTLAASGISFKTMPKLRTLQADAAQLPGTATATARPATTSSVPVAAAPTIVSSSIVATSTPDASSTTTTTTNPSSTNSLLVGLGVSGVLCIVFAAILGLLHYKKQSRRNERSNLFNQL